MIMIKRQQVSITIICNAKPIYCFLDQIIACYCRTSNTNYSPDEARLQNLLLRLETRFWSPSKHSLHQLLTLRDNTTVNRHMYIIHVCVWMFTHIYVECSTRCIYRSLYKQAGLHSELHKKQQIWNNTMIWTQHVKGPAGKKRPTSTCHFQDESEDPLEQNLGYRAARPWNNTVNIYIALHAGAGKMLYI